MLYSDSVVNSASAATTVSFSFEEFGGGQSIAKSFPFIQ